MQPEDRPLSVKIRDAEVIEDQRGRTLFLGADDDGEILRMQIRVLDDDTQTNLRGKSALHYLLGELGMMDIDAPGDLISKALHRWAWDKVASIATHKESPSTTSHSLSLLGDNSEVGRFVYVISAADVDPPLCKIGITNSPEKRLAQLSTGSPHTLHLELTRFSRNARAVERAAHSHFSECRRNGEWFAINSDSAISYIIDATRAA